MRSSFVLLAACVLLSGCELVADFDRSKIARDAATAPGDDDASTSEGDAMVVDPPDEDGGAEPVEDSGADEDSGAGADDDAG